MAKSIENSKFMTLSSNGAASFKKRVALLGSQLEGHQRTLINDLETKIADIDYKLGLKMDFSPNSSTSLRPGALEGDSAAKWVAEIHSLKVSRKYLVDELNVAVATYNDIFGELESEA